MWTEPDLAQCYLCGTVRLVDSMLPAGNGLYQCKGIVMCLNRVRRSRGQLMISLKRKPKIPRGQIFGKLKQLAVAITGSMRVTGTVAATLRKPNVSMTGSHLPSGTMAATLQKSLAALTSSVISSPAFFGAGGTPSDGGGATTVQIPVPSGVVAGSGVIVLLYVETSQGVTPPAGFTEVSSSPVIATGTQAHYLHLYQHVATGVETGNYTFTIAAGLFWRNGEAIRIDNATPISGSIFDVTNSAAKSTTTDGTIPAVSVTTTGSNRLLLWCAGNYAGGTDTTPPTGFTERVQRDGYEIATKLQAAAGASGSLTGTLNVNSATTAWVGAIYPGSAIMPPGEYFITGTTYYVSSTGNDANAGTSTGTPWLTVSRAMSQSYAAGDALLFERGGLYYTSGIDKTVTANGSQRLIVGAYGTGADPILDCYQVLGNSAAWTNTSGNIWRIDMTAGGSHTGNPSTNANPGHLRVGETTYGQRRNSTAAMVAQWEFYGASPYVYVYSVGNPTTVAGASGLRCAPNTAIVKPWSNLEVVDLELRGTGGHGVVSTGHSPSNNVRVARCHMHHIGGSILEGFGDGTARYGNGVEVWFGADGWTIEDCVIHDVYDTTLTVQGETSSGSPSIKNVLMRNNECYNATFLFETFVRGTVYATSVVSNIVVEHNHFHDGGTGFGANTRSDQQNKSIFTTWDMTIPVTGFYIQDNLIERAARYYRYSYPSFDTSIIVSRRNDIRLAAGTSMTLLENNRTIEQAALWASERGTEVGSTFTVL